MAGTLYELVRKYADCIAVLRRNGISVEDADWVDLYEEYRGMIDLGLKRTYIHLHLAEKYRISTRQVQRIIARFSGAAG
ncbi:MAG: hypothetical protein LUC33_00895 [Prevotellaceae bacterium]|nr:hypothetical protein [Prevotellaceae bacterium]